MNIQGWFLIGSTGLISLLFKGLSRVFSSTTFWKHQFFSTQSSLWSNCLILTCAKSHQSCLTLCDPMDCSPAGSSVHGILQARILEWVVTTFSRGSSWPRDLTGISYISCMGRWVLYHYHHLGSPHPCMTIRKTISLTIWTFAGKVMSLLFNTLFRFVISQDSGRNVNNLSYAHDTTLMG